MSSCETEDANSGAGAGSAVQEDSATPGEDNGRFTPRPELAGTYVYRTERKKTKKGLKVFRVQGFRGHASKPRHLVLVVVVLVVGKRNHRAETMVQAKASLLTIPGFESASWRSVRSAWTG